MAEDLRRALAKAAEKLQQNDVAGTLAALEPLLGIDVEPTTRVEALRIVSLAKLLAQDAKGSLEALDQALAMSDQIAPLLRARVLERRALVRQANADLEGARTDLGRAARAFAEAGETQVRAQVEDRRGAFAAAKGDVLRAVALHLCAAALKRGEKPPSLADGDRVPELLKLLESVPAKEEKSAEPLGEARSLVDAAAAAHLAGGRPIARKALERALELLGPPAPATRALRAEALHNLGVALSDLNEHKLALERLEAALALDLEAGAARDAIATRLRLALASRRAGDAARARKAATDALEQAKSSGDPPLVIEALLELSSACLAAGEGESALASAKEAIEASAALPPLLARATLHAASCAKVLGKKQAARDGFQKARELALKAGDKMLASAAERELAQI